MTTTTAAEIDACITLRRLRVGRFVAFGGLFTDLPRARGDLLTQRRPARGACQPGWQPLFEIATELRRAGRLLRARVVSESYYGGRRASRGGPPHSASDEEGDSDSRTRPVPPRGPGKGGSPWTSLTW